MSHQIKLVTANDPGLFEERLARALEAAADDATIIDVAFDTAVDRQGALHFSALIRLQQTESWS